MSSERIEMIGLFFVRSFSELSKYKLLYIHNFPFKLIDY
jgi:hypothetical protein